MGNENMSSQPPRLWCNRQRGVQNYSQRGPQSDGSRTADRHLAIWLGGTRQTARNRRTRTNAPANTLIAMRRSRPPDQPLQGHPGRSPGTQSPRAPQKPAPSRNVRVRAAGSRWPASVMRRQQGRPVPQISIGWASRDIDRHAFTGVCRERPSVQSRVTWRGLAAGHPPQSPDQCGDRSHPDPRNRLSGRCRGGRSLVTAFLATASPGSTQQTTA